MWFEVRIPIFAASTHLGCCFLMAEIIPIEPGRVIPVREMYPTFCVGWVTWNMLSQPLGQLWFHEKLD